MLQPLPSELHDVICGHLYLLKSLGSLKAYSLTCHKFYSIAQKYIFRTLVVYHPQTSLERSAQLSRFLGSSPHIAKHVHSLEISELIDTPFGIDGIPTLTNLKNLVINNGCIWKGHSMLWPKVSAMHFIPLNKAFRNLVRLSLSGITFSRADILNSCTALKELTLEDVRFVVEDVEDFLNSNWVQSRNNNQTKLENLHLLSISSSPFTLIFCWLNSPCCPFDIKGLRHLSIHGFSPDYSKISQILQGCSSTLKTFSFGFQSYSTSNPSEMRLVDATFPDLQALHILCKIFNNPLSQDHLAWVLNILQNNNFPSTVTEISITVEPGCNNLPCDSFWEAVDTFLSLHFDSLRRLRFVIAIGTSPKISYLDGAKYKFPQLNEKGVVLTVETRGGKPPLWSWPKSVISI